MPSSKSITHVNYAYWLTNYRSGGLCKWRLHKLAAMVKKEGAKMIELEYALLASLNKTARQQP